ncbi:MAG: hypothetical protein K0Q66_461 [Chitinophagaceae bacterium]|nr:hypothetical protein [Chitinophagaceae bacterium]
MDLIKLFPNPVANHSPAKGHQQQRPPGARSLPVKWKKWYLRGIANQRATRERSGYQGSFTLPLTRVSRLHPCVHGTELPDPIEDHGQGHSKQHREFPDDNMFQGVQEMLC